MSVSWCVQLDSDIGDCACSVESVDFFNNDQVFPVVDELMQRNYFRYYKVCCVCLSVCLSGWYVDHMLSNC